MNSTIRILQTIGSPFAPALSESIPDGNEALNLYTLAFKNKIGLYFLEALKRQRELGDLQSEYDKGYFRYSETVVTAARISKLLDLAGVNHVIYKFIKPYPSTPSDVDILFLCSDDEYKEALQMLFTNGYFRLGAAPHQVIAYDLRGGFENMDTSLRGGKKGGIYYIDLYDEIASSNVIYMDKEKLGKYVTLEDLGGAKLKTLKPEADLAVGIAHSVIPEQLYTLSDYYTALFCLAEMSKEDIANFINIVRENNLVLASRASLRITALFHQVAHGFIPEPMQRVSDELGIKNLGKDTLQRSDFKAPYRYSVLTVVRAMGAKIRERKFRKSIMVQIGNMLNPRLARYVVSEVIWRRRRETY